ncbi:MAG: hypothetical protein ABF649_02900 [Bacillus sp. (in: firmicutes)]
MEKAVIVGPYHFIGIHLCSALLEKGIDIMGISYPQVQINKLEDKKMVFGRNANFMEKDWGYLVCADVEVIIFDLYTLDRKNELVLTLLSAYKEAALIKEMTKKKIVIICPITIEKKIMEESISLFELHQQAYQIIYLPTIYGPWQPEIFLFQQILADKRKTIKKHEMEYTEDAIYIDDAITEIVNQIVQGKEREVVLKSNVENHWNKCKNSLDWKQDTKETSICCFSDSVSTIIVKNKNNISENLEIQRKHIMMYID